uniref:Uncharacterized protein n=1 Tax=Oryza glumipatula TaxID=40148 RepID=A0A0D9Z9J1_9ORYZ
MVALDLRNPPSAATTVKEDQQFTVFIDGVETALHEGVIQWNGGTVTLVSTGVLAVDRLQHVVVRGGGSGDVSFTRCGFAAAEACGVASFHRCDAVRADGAREVAVHRCRSADVERAGVVAIRRCKGAARVRGAGELRVGRCHEANVGGCADVAVGRCRAACADWCGAIGIERCGSADVSRCGAVRVDRCRAASVSGCGSVAVRCGKVNVIEQPPVCQEKPMYHLLHAEPVYAIPLEISSEIKLQ